MLGELTEADEEQVEIRLLTDAEYQREFDMAVDDIVDRYVAGEFAGAERQRVRDYFFQSDARQEKLRFALALKEQKSPTFTKRPKTRWTAYVAIAASLIAIVSIGFIVWRALKPATDLNDGLVALQAAYREERPIEGRLSDFGYVPLPNQRGESAKVDYVQRDLAGALLIKARRDRPNSASHQAAGKYYLMVHQFPEAQKELEAAITLDPNNAKLHNDLGVLFLEECRTQGSSAQTNQLEFCGRSLEQVQKAIDLDNNLLESLFNRAVLFQLMNSPEQAITAWKQYLEKDGSSRWAEEARKNLKQLEQEQHRVSGDGTDSFQAFLEAENHADDSTAFRVISGAYTSAGNEITNRLIDSVLKLDESHRPVDPAECWRSLSYVARLEQDQSGDRFTSDLVAYYTRALPGLKPLLANARRHMRTAYSLFEKGNFKDAIGDYTQAKLSYAQANDKAGQALAEYRIAHCYVLLPDLEKARLTFNQLLTVCEKSEYRWLTAQCLYGLAHASIDSSEYSKAIDYNDRALAQFEKIGDLNGILKCLTQLADVNQAMNLIGKSLRYLSRAWALSANAQVQPIQRWGIVNQIGFSLGSMQLNAAALFYQKEALSIALQIGTPLLISRSYGYVGSAYATLKMYPEALNEATQAFQIGAQIPNDPAGVEIMANASLQLGNIYRETGRCDKAIDNYDTSLRLYRKVNFSNGYVARKGKLRCFITTGDNTNARKELDSVLSLAELYRSKITTEDQRDSFFDAEHAVYDLAISYAAGTENNYLKALEYSEKSRGRSLLDAVQRGAEVRKKQGQVEIKLPFVTSSLLPTEIQARMPATAQIVEYAALDDRIVIWVITNKEIKYEVKSIDAQALTEKVSAFLETVTQPPGSGDDKFKERAAELYTILISPVERHLDHSKSLCIVPDKVLNYLPYTALVSPATGNYLVEDYNLGVAASGTLFVNLSRAAERQDRSSEEKLLTAGNPNFSRELFPSLRELPASASECKSVFDLYPRHELLLGEQATETAIKREMETADVAHLAMHFVLNERSEMLSGFPVTPERSDANDSVMTDGFLQSYEIYSLNLRHMRLAVLSACQTGIERQYRGEGAVGATRPFFVAGVPTVVASLWSVDSDASRELMVNFHKHRHDPLPVSQALQQAQIEMIHGSELNFRHPYYWAPFLAIGGLSH